MILDLIRSTISSKTVRYIMYMVHTHSNLFTQPTAKNQDCRYRHQSSLLQIIFKKKEIKLYKKM